MLSIGIVIVSILAVAYLIFKNTTLPVLFCFVGLVTLAVVAVISPEPLIRSLPICSRPGTAGLGMNIIKLLLVLLITWIRSVLQVLW